MGGSIALPPMRISYQFLLTTSRQSSTQFQFSSSLSLLIRICSYLILAVPYLFISCDYSHLNSLSNHLRNHIVSAHRFIQSTLFRRCTLALFSISFQPRSSPLVSRKYLSVGLTSLSNPLVSDQITNFPFQFKAHPHFSFPVLIASPNYLSYHFQCT